MTDALLEELQALTAPPEKKKADDEESKEILAAGTSIDRSREEIQRRKLQAQLEMEHERVRRDQEKADRQKEMYHARLQDLERERQSQLEHLQRNAAYNNFKKGDLHMYRREIEERYEREFEQLASEFQAKTLSSAALSQSFLAVMDPKANVAIDSKGNISPEKKGAFGWLKNHF